MEGATRRTHAFMGIPIETAPGVFVPSPDSEVVGRSAIEALQKLQGAAEARLIDMGCGSGNLTCAIALNVPNVRVWACDLTEPAVELARRNVETYKLSQRVSVVHGDLFAPLANEQLRGTIDVIISNPPHTPSVMLDKGGALLAKAPREAVDGGPNGTAFHVRIIREAIAYLREGGSLVLEIEPGQERALELILQRFPAFERPRFAVDKRGNARAVIATRVSAR